MNVESGWSKILSLERIYFLSFTVLEDKDGGSKP